MYTYTLFESLYVKKFIYCNILDKCNTEFESPDTKIPTYCNIIV